jgi:hypothetical protein
LGKTTEKNHGRYNKEKIEEKNKKMLHPLSMDRIMNIMYNPDQSSFNIMYNPDQRSFIGPAKPTIRHAPTFSYYPLDNSLHLLHRIYIELVAAPDDHYIHAK